MVVKALNIKLNLKKLDVRGQEQMSPEFLKLNPQHTIPTLVDNGFALWESRAILGYLVDKYAKTDTLYPKDPQKRALVNQRLFFDIGTLHQRFAAYYIPIMRQGQPPNPELFKSVEEALEYLDGFLAKTKFVAGDEPTIADYSLIAGYSTIITGGHDFSRFKNITRWYESRSTLPGIEANEEGLVAMKAIVEKMKSEKKL